MESVGVDCSGIATCEEPSGVAVILVSSKGENCIVVTPGANAKVTPQDLEMNLSAIRRAGIVLAQLEIPLETVEYLSNLCKREGVPLILDPAPACALPARIFRNIAWLTPNETEARFYAGSLDGDADDHARTAQSLLSNGCYGVILKMGSRGVYVTTEGTPGQMVPAFPVPVVDTTAAGDAFNGGFATGLMLGNSPLESARFAAAVAAISVTRAGAQPSMPSMHEVEGFFESRLVPGVGR